MSAKKIVCCAIPAVKNKSAEASAYAWWLISDSSTGTLGELGRDRRVNADLHLVLVRGCQGFFDLLVDRLAAVDALAAVGHHRLRPRYLFVVLLPVLVHEDLDAPDPRFGLGQHGVRFQIGDALLELRQLLQQLLPLRLRRRLRRCRVQRDVELRRLVFRDGQPPATECRKSPRGDRDRVIANRERLEGVRPLRVGRRFETRTGLGADGDDGRVGEGGLVGAADGAPDTTAMIRHLHLRLRRGRRLGPGGSCQANDDRHSSHPSSRQRRTTMHVSRPSWSAASRGTQPRL
jgi:hypothetical protein